jgi:hypothetical protein
MPTLSDASGQLVTYGCRIVVKSARYNVNHHGIVTYIHWVGGVFFVHIIHNTKEWGVQRTSLEDFAQGLPFYVVAYPQTPQHAENIVATAVANLQKPYSLFFQNCEHFCNYCYRLEKRSESIDRFLVGSLVVGGFVAAAFIASNQRQ